MKKLLLACMASLPLFAAPEVVGNLIDLNISKVEEKADVLKETHNHPYTEMLIGIHAFVDQNSACVTIAGQEMTINTVKERRKLTAPQSGRIRVLGAVDPLNDACIDLFVPPVEKVLTFPVNVLTGGFVPARGETKLPVKIGNLYYEVGFNSDTGEAFVRPLK